MLLLLTTSGDGSSDIVVSRLGNSEVFRLNYDMWEAYEITITPSFWSIKNPAGHEITSESASSAFWWKAFTVALDEDKHTIFEIKYIFRELYSWFWTRGLARGNSPDYHNKFGKANILSIASKHFDIPRTLVSVGLASTDEVDSCEIVAKSLSSVLNSDNKLLVTTSVPSTNSLDPAYPWFLQETIHSDWDITVFQCGQSFFPFKRSRAGLEGLDWRTEQKFFYEEQEWFPFDMTTKQLGNLKALSHELGLDFGRYDFMLSREDNKLIFLEVNASGQWAFLDIENKYGLQQAVVDWLKG
jgi:hypothetical protein